MDSTGVLKVRGGIWCGVYGGKSVPSGNEQVASDCKSNLAMLGTTMGMGKGDRKNEIGAMKKMKRARSMTAKKEAIEAEMQM